MSHPSDTVPATDQSLVITAELENIAAIRMAIRSVCEAADCESIEQTNLVRGIAQLELAITELVSNVIRHGHEDVPGGRIQVHMSFAKEGVFQLELLHDGRPFDGNSVEVADITEPQEGGMGLFLIAECVDQIVYDTAPDGGCRIQVTKSFQTPLEEND